MKHRSFLLELKPDSFRPKAFLVPDITLAAATTRDRARCQRLWLEVGQGYWSDRTRWRDSRWDAHLNRTDIHFCIASNRAQDIGFFELVVQSRGVKLEGFGLLPHWRGRGLGGGLLSAATAQAFATGAKRVWLHTATDDHQNALPNYKARGYRVYRERELKSPMPSQ